MRECVDSARKSTPYAFQWVRTGGDAVEVRGNPLPGGGLAATLSDVTPGKTDQGALPVIGEQLRRILEGSPIAVGITAPGDRLVFHNERWSEMAGIAHGEGASVDLRAMFKSLTDREFLVKELHEKGFVRDAEMEFIRVGGEAMWVLVSMHRMKLDGETVTIGWFSDITASKLTEEELRHARDELEERVEERTGELSREIEEHERTEQALRTSEERLRDLAEAGSDWFWEMDRDLRFTHVSKSVRNVLGVEPEYLLGRSRPEMAAPGDDPGKWEKHLDDLKSRVPFRDFQYEIVRPDGTIQYAKTSGKPVFDEAGAFTGYRGTGTNVTAQVEAEMRAAKAREQLIDAIESLDDAFVLFDAEERFVLCNSKYREYYPIAAPLLKPGKKFHDLVEESVGMGEMADTGMSIEEVVEDRLERFRDAAQPFFQQLRSGRWVRVSEHRTSDGGTVSIRTDVSDLRRAEEESRAAKEEAEKAQDQLVTAIESLSEAFLLFDAEDRFVLCNSKYKEFYPSVANLCVPGVSFEEMLRVFADSGEDEAALENPGAWVAARMEKHNNPGQPFPQHLSNGRWLQVSERKTKDGGTVSLRTDITPQIEADRRASEAQELLLDAIESVSEAFILFDADDRFVLCNSKFREYYRITTPLLKPGITFREMVRTAVERGELLDIGEGLDEWLEARMEEHRNPAGPHTHHLSSGRWMRVSDGRTKSGGFVSVRTDISDLRWAEEDLRAANDELEAFAYSVAHDLRAPLRTMDGFCQALLEDYGDSLEPEGQDYLHRVRGGSQRMALLIDELLELSRVTRADFKRMPVNLSEIAKSIMADFRDGTPERRVTFDVEPDISVYGDARLLRVLLDNLIGNAWKFTSKHSRANIEFGATSHGGLKTYFIRDDGAGFDMKYVDKLFQPFQRLHTTEEFEGTGIGLATVARVAARHGGRVWAQSGIEKGTTIYFTIGTGRKREHE